MQLAPIFSKKKTKTKKKKNQKAAFKYCNYSLDIFSYHRKKLQGSLTVVFLNQNVCAALLSFLLFCLKAASLLKIRDRLGFEKNLTLEKKVFFMLILFLRNDTQHFFDNDANSCEICSSHKLWENETYLKSRSLLDTAH